MWLFYPLCRGRYCRPVCAFWGDTQCLPGCGKSWPSPHTLFLYIVALRWTSTPSMKQSWGCVCVCVSMCLDVYVCDRPLGSLNPRTALYYHIGFEESKKAALTSEHCKDAFVELLLLFLTLFAAGAGVFQVRIYICVCVSVHESVCVCMCLCV